jgi:hypothetical protein
MQNAAYFQAKAAHCRGLLEFAADQQVIDQLRLWISDFETAAATAEGQATSSLCSRPASWREGSE